MQGNPRLRDFDATLDAIIDPRNPFERYNALRLAELMEPDLKQTERVELTVMVERALRTFSARRDKDVQTVGRRLLGTLKGSADYG